MGRQRVLWFMLRKQLHLLTGTICGVFFFAPIDFAEVRLQPFPPFIWQLQENVFCVRSWHWLLIGRCCILILDFPNGQQATPGTRVCVCVQDILSPSSGVTLLQHKVKKKQFLSHFFIYWVHKMIKGTSQEKPALLSNHIRMRRPVKEGWYLDVFRSCVGLGQCSSPRRPQPDLKSTFGLMVLNPLKGWGKDASWLTIYLILPSFSSECFIPQLSGPT